MNKVTLSVAALAAISVPVQVQAAELSGAELEAANKTHYANISALIAEAISQVEKKVDESLREFYILQLSTLQNEAKEILEANKEELNEAYYQGEVVKISGAANNAQEFYTVDQSFATLKQLLSDQKDATKDYSLAGAKRLEKLNAIDLSDIENAISAAKADEVATEDEVKDITGKISAKTTKINGIMDGIAVAQATMEANNADYNEVVAAVDAAVKLYQAEVQRVIANLPGDPDVYGDWQKEALKKLTEAYNNILAAKADNEAAHADGIAEDATKNCTGKKEANLDAINAANALFADAEGKGGIYNNDYKTKKDNQEAWNNAATGSDNGTAKLTSDLTSLENDLGANSVSSKADDIQAIKDNIAALNNDIKAKYDKHELTDGMFDERISGISEEISALRTASAALIQNYKDWSTMRSEVFTDESSSLQAKYDAAVTNAQKVTSVEGVDVTYKADDHMADQKKAITDALDKLNTNIVETYAETLKATEYKDGNYGTDKADASTKINNYESWTKAAQGSFTTAATNIKDAEAALADLKKAVGKNTSVTTNGKWDGPTYDEAIQELQKEIQDIRDAITAANAKQGEEHKNLMATAAGMTFTSVDDITKKFGDNKVAYDNDVKVNAANKVVSRANELVKVYTDQLVAAANKLNPSDVHYSTVNDEIDDLKTNVSDANSKIPSDWISKSYDDKLAESPSVIAELSVVNTTLEGLEVDIKAAVDMADKASENYKNWTSLNGKVTDNSSDKSISKKIDDVKGAVASYGAVDHWNTILNGYSGELTTIGKNIKDDYESSDMKLSVEATVAGYDTQLTKLFDNVAKVATDASNNETAMHAATTGFDTKLDDLQKKWQEVYDYITTTDKSSTVDTWLDQMAAQQKAVNDIVKTVDDEYKAGNAYTKLRTLTESINNIATAIDGINIAHANQYPDAVKADNEKQHLTLFLNGAYADAEKAFTDAVAKLNQFAAIQNSAIQIAIERLAETHAAIYANAPKLRELMTKEDEAYKPYKVEGNTVIYSAADYITEANTIQDAIEDKLGEYVNEVNKAAYDEYINDIQAAKLAIDAAMNSVKDYNKDTLPKELTKLNDDITAAAGNVTTDSEGIPTDKDFAINLDKWTASIDNVTEALPVALNKAAQNEYDFRLGAAKTQYDTDKNGINALPGITAQTYLDQLEEIYTNSVKAAETAYGALTAEGGAGVHVETIGDVLNTIAGYYYGETGRSQAYNDAKDKSDNNEAYNTLANTYVPGATAAVDELKESALELFTMHKDNSSAAAAIDEIYTLINNKLVAAGSDTDLADNLEDYSNDLNPRNRDGELSKKIVEVQGRIIAAEKTDLNAQVELLKEQYNKAIEAGNKIEDMKAYEEAIAKYKTDLAAIDPDLSFDDAKAELLGFEAKMAETYQELAKLPDAAAYDKAIAEIDEVIATTEGQLQSVESMVNEFSQLINEFGVKLDALNGSFDALKADYAAKVEAGTVLFYKDNLVSDIKKFQPEIEEFATGDLKARYDALVENRGAYQVITGNMARYESLFKDYKAIADTYTYEGYIYDVTSDEQVPFRATVETRILKKYDEQIAEIEEKNSNTELKYSDIQTYTSLESDIYDYLRTATYYEAEGQINNTGSKLEAVAIDVKKYGPNSYQTLLEAKAAIDASLVNAAKYNQDAYDDNNIYNDIDGNDVSYTTPDYSEPMPIRCPYMDEAWPTIKSKLASILEDIDAFAQEVEDKQFLLGDANHDGNIDVRDYQVVRNWILTAKTFAEIDEEKAFGGDVNSDKRFNVADLTCISNLIFDPDFVIPNAAAASARARVMGAAEDKITLTTESEETTIFGKTVRLAVNLDNVEAFTAGQMDIILPQGMKLAGQSLSSRANGHEVLANEISNGTFRLLVSTVENSEFNGSNGALIFIDVEVGSDYNGGNISIDEVVFSDAQGKSYYLTNNGPIVPTGIDGIEAATVKERIYSVGGQMMKAVKKGINIIVGENNKTQKVVK